MSTTHARTSRGLIKTSFQVDPEQLETIDLLCEPARAPRSLMIRQLLDLGIREYARRERLATRGETNGAELTGVAGRE
jgi:hypothetical protein